MSDIKNLFGKNKNAQVLSDSSLQKEGSKIESVDYLKSNLKQKKRFIPYIDFSSASNFARYGSAEKYYTDSINYISSEYPYDGSLREKIDWNLSGSYFDKHLFDNEYPRTNGFILIGKNYGSPVSDVGGYDTFSAASKEYIFVKGSPHPTTGNGSLRDNWKDYNLYNTSSFGRYNLEIQGDNGLTLEFWLNKDDYDSSDESSKEIVFDLWNSGTFDNSDYGRFRVELTGGASTDVLEPVFNIELRSGSAGFSYRNDITGPHSTTVSLSSSVSLTGSWNHFALSFQNTGSQMSGKLYCNGQLAHSLVTGSSIGQVTGSMIATIGSLITSVSGTYGAIGAAKLSASLDDFRYWRRIRTSEKIGKYWFTSINGGTNSDITNAATASTKYSYENPLDLGVYYKFNEGINSTTSSVPNDAIILDYSGRTTNGAWTGYTYGSRFTGSAMVISKAAKSEFKDPIVYPNQPDVASLRTDKTAEGLVYDQQNNASLYHSFPAWIIEEDESNNSDGLKDLTQILGSYFDTLQLQIEAVPKLKELKYPSGSNKPYPFADKLVNSLGFVTSEVLENATALEYFASRNDVQSYSKKLNETKNIIYQNIYNNLNYIFKTKGTEKSFRNLIRCYGIDEELVKLNLYASNTSYEFRDNKDFRVIKKRYADFNKSTRFNATVFQQTSSLNANSREYISSSAEMMFRGNTYEAEVIFPDKLDFNSPYYVSNDFVTASIFGCHTSGTSGNWGSPDVGNFQVQSVRPGIHSSDAYFQLTGSSGGHFPLLTSSVFSDVYDDSKWNFAVKIKPTKYPQADGVSGSATGSYDIEFSGYNYVLDVLVNSFQASSTISSLGARQFLSANKRFFVGAHRTNFTGGTLQKADSKISSTRVWMDYLDNSVIKTHAQDVENFGSQYPYKNAYISQMSKSLGDDVVNIPQMETLALYWDFETITGSNASGQFVVPDVSSGSVSLANRWGWLGPIAKYQHTGLGYDFEASDTGSIDRRYVQSAKQQLPEVGNSSDMVSIIDDTTNQIFTRDSRPIDYYFAFEKSMYGIVSEQIINYFGTIVAFNDLIGAPVNRYRQDYKDLEKLRSLYFERVQNTPDFEKFMEYYKWIDSSIGLMLQQLIPASANFTEDLRNMVESHVLERNKYWNKFPTLEMKASDPEAGLRGINEMLYSGKRGLAPIPTTATDSNCEWWLDRTERNNPNITSGVSSVDTDRNTIRRANDFKSGSGPTLAVSRGSTSTTTTYTGQAYALRNFTKTYKLTVDESPEIHGGSNFPKGKRLDYAHTEIKTRSAFDSSGLRLRITASSIDSKSECNDVIDPNAKSRLDGAFVDTSDAGAGLKSSVGYKGGKSSIFAPFSLFSSSVSPSYLSGFRSNTQLTNFHEDSYGDDNETPIQGPFTNAHVGGWKYRHQDINTDASDTTLTRPEAWELEAEDKRITISSRTFNSALPRATMLRDAYAKRPLNIANIKWGTGSQVAGNYQHDYQIVQTSGRKINNRYFVKSEGFVPDVNFVTASSTYLSGVIDYALPRYDLTGSNKFIFVERFSAPGGPEVTRGNLDTNSEEFGIYNELNYRNLTVRNALQSWQTEHCGQFGISPTGSPGDGTTPSQHTVNPLGYDGVIASYHKVNRNPVTMGALIGASSTELTTSVNYDNWYVQHAIPQSELQYAWINDSYDRSKDQPFGYASSYSVPSGSTSTTASAVQFITSSFWGPNWTATGTPVSFTQFWFQTGWSPASRYRYTIDPTTNLLSAAEYWTANFGQSINGFFNNINGPYQYPSWKQIRTGETPVARYHKNNNILSILKSSSTGRTDQYRNFVQPPVEFKYRPLNTVHSAPVGGTVSQPITLRHTYGNNKCLFSEGPTNDGTSDSGSIANWLLQPDTNGSIEVYDRIVADASLDADLSSVEYREIIYPRSTNTGLAQTRGRTSYAEVANGTLNADGTFSASLSNGTNGIDRGPIERRTFWRNQAKYRNRIIGSEFTQSFQMNGGSPASGEYWYYVSGALPNSQGYYDGFATSLYGLGRTPITSDYAITPLITPFGTYPKFNGWRTSGSLSIVDFPDMGELNSANDWTLRGLMGTNVSGALINSQLMYAVVHYPTASAYYYHYPHITSGILSSSAYGYQTGSLFANRPLEWRTEELSGKKPFFDSYEEYAEDIRGLGKSLTVIPEFKISEHMPYYLKNNFRSQNDKILSLPGGNITSSANSEEASRLLIGGGFSISTGIRVFDKKFFNDYSNSDFQKYFGEFEGSYPDEKSEITLRCNGVKKLLPYNGFYPQQRSLQLASLFSQSIAPCINGIGWRRGAADGSSHSAQSGALALQSLLQPYYAPGIMYNTIKSGVAVDWAAMTGSALSIASIGGTGGTWGSQGVLSSSTNYRIPFHSILDPLASAGIPLSASTDSKMFMLMPSRQNENIVSYWESTIAYAGGPRIPWTSIDNDKRSTAKDTAAYASYKAATNNFFAEIPNFFLKNNNLTTIYSDKQETVGDKLEKGKYYYMDITLEKTPDLVMMKEDSREVFLPNTGALNFNDVPLFDGRLFGPPMIAGDVGKWGHVQIGSPGSAGYSSAIGLATAPAYAPYTPSYFYGKSRMTLKFYANENNIGSNFSWNKYFNEVSRSFTNEKLSAMFDSIAGTEYAAKPSPASSSAMQVTASIKWDGIAKERNIIRDEFGKVNEIRDINAGDNKWVISPFMETPVLDFANNTYQNATGPRGMWGGYGEIPTGGSGIKLRAEPSLANITFPSDNIDFTEIAFPVEPAREQKIGQVNSAGKDISEAIVAIPYLTRPMVGDEAYTTENTFLDDRYFFSLRAYPGNAWDASNVFKEIKTSLDNSDGEVGISQDLADKFTGLFDGRFPELGTEPKPIRTTSISEMINTMGDYVLPPELDFYTYSKENSPNDFVEPFAMYMFEFKHHLDQQDLADIWQGLMPKISTDAKLDSTAISHKRYPIIEFFGDRTIPEDIRWMVFKVKKKANKDYYKLTADVTDDEKFSKDFFTTKNGEIPYSYNWPYDYFSLVELANLEVGTKFKK